MRDLVSKTRGFNSPNSEKFPLNQVLEPRKFSNSTFACINTDINCLWPGRYFRQVCPNSGIICQCGDLLVRFEIEPSRPIQDRLKTPQVRRVLATGRQDLVRHVRRLVENRSGRCDK